LQEISKLTDDQIREQYGKYARWTADGKRLISITVNGYKFRINRIKSYQNFTFSDPKADPRQTEFNYI
jgi:hypothetical protein